MIVSCRCEEEEENIEQVATQTCESMPLFGTQTSCHCLAFLRTRQCDRSPPISNGALSSTTRIQLWLCSALVLSFRLCTAHLTWHLNSSDAASSATLSRNTTHSRILWPCQGNAQDWSLAYVCRLSMQNLRLRRSSSPPTRQQLPQAKM